MIHTDISPYGLHKYVNSIVNEHRCSFYTALLKIFSYEKEHEHVINKIIRGLRCLMCV